MKTFITCTIIWICSVGSIHSQIRSDFVLVSGGLNPSLAIDRQSNVHAAWWRGGDIYYAVFDSIGNQIRASQKLTSSNITFGFFSGSPHIAVNADHAVVVWKEILGTAVGNIRGQLFTIDGKTVFEQFQFNEGGEPLSPDVAFLSDTTFIVVWEGVELRESSGIYGQIVTTSLNAVGSNMLLSDVSSSEILREVPRVASNSLSGDLIVVWRDNRLGSNKVFGRLFFADGTPKDACFLISEDPKLTELRFFSVAMAPEGKSGVVWGGKKDDRWDIQLRRFLNNGIPLGPSVQLNSNLVDVLDYPSVDIAFDVDGTSVAMWEQEERGYSKIFAQRFLSDGRPLGGTFNASVKLDSSPQVLPNVILRNGKIYTAWVSEGGIWANIIDFNHPPLRGDVNNDDIVDVADLIRAIEIIVGTGPAATPEEQATADVNNDGQIDVRDLIVLIRMILGIG